MKKFCTSLLLLFSLIFTIKAQTITIAAAADLRYAMEELKTNFQKNNSGANIKVIYGSSGNLYQQIVNKAPFDLFFSADISYPQKLDSLKLTSCKPTRYATGALVLWSAKLDVGKGMDLLKTKQFNKLSIANPAHAPYGKRALECLKYYKLYELVENKIVKGENISQAAQFVLTGNAEVGIIALSLAISPEMSGKGKYFVIDAKSYSKQEQAYIIMKSSKNQTLAKKITQYIESIEGKKILTKFGFKIP
jgi:molybdate transport system substrate-binding protein